MYAYCRDSLVTTSYNLKVLCGRKSEVNLVSKVQILWKLTFQSPYFGVLTMFFIWFVSLKQFTWWISFAVDAFGLECCCSSCLLVLNLLLSDSCWWSMMRFVVSVLAFGGFMLWLCCLVIGFVRFEWSTLLGSWSLLLMIFWSSFVDDEIFPFGYKEPKCNLAP